LEWDSSQHNFTLKARTIAPDRQNLRSAQDNGVVERQSHKRAYHCECAGASNRARHRTADQRIAIKADKPANRIAKIAAATQFAAWQGLEGHGLVQSIKWSNLFDSFPADLGCSADRRCRAPFYFLSSEIGDRSLLLFSTPVWV
jgi:hypothetical protein